jgi:hypothetical protein
MTSWILIVLVGVAMFAIARWGRRGESLDRKATVLDVPSILAAVRGSTDYPAFAVFIFDAPGTPNTQDAVNLQLSLENGVIGLDWVLTSQRNIEDQQRFLDFARKLRHDPQPQEMNGVRYIRVEDGDIARLCRGVVTDLYGLPATTQMDLVQEGIRWPT